MFLPAPDIQIIAQEKKAEKSYGLIKPSTDQLKVADSKTRTVVLECRVSSSLLQSEFLNRYGVILLIQIIHEKCSVGVTIRIMTHLFGHKLEYFK